MTRAGVRASIRESWDRIGATVCAGAAGLMVAISPASSIDNLVGGWPATFLVGLVLTIGAVLNLVGLLKPVTLLQPVGLVVQLVPLALLVIGLCGLKTTAGVTIALLVAALGFRIVHQYRDVRTETVVITVAKPDTHDG